MNQFLPPADNNYTNRDRLLPSQPLMCQFFKDFSAGGERGFIAALDDCVNSVLPIKSVHDKFDIKLAPGMTYETLGSDLSTLHFLQLLVKLIGAKHVFEIGTYIGVSAMFLAEAVGDDGYITTIERGREFGSIAEQNFGANALFSRIGLVIDDVTKALPRLSNRNNFDMIFLDGDKAHYGELLMPLIAQLRPGGLLVVDDVFCQGDTLNPTPTTDKGRGVRNLLDQVAKLDGFSPVILPYGDGLLLLRKPA